MSDGRYKNRNWRLPDALEWEDAAIAVLMDIRDELQAIRRLGECYRIPRALDAMHEMGVDLRRRKRVAAKRRKTTKVTR